MEKLVLVLDGMESDETEISREKVIYAASRCWLVGAGWEPRIKTPPVSNPSNWFIRN